MGAEKDSLQEKKLYLKKMSQHFKEMADKQGDEMRRVVANTFSKNSDILEDLYSQIERLSSDLDDAKSHIQELNTRIEQLSSTSKAVADTNKENT